MVNILLTKELETLKQFAKSPLSSPNRNRISVNKNSCSSVKDLRFEFLRFRGDVRSVEVFDSPFQ